jgi:hypothetical protein
MPALRACAGHVVCEPKVGGVVEAVIAAFRALAKRAEQKCHVDPRHFDHRSPCHPIRKSFMQATKAGACVVLVSRLPFSEAKSSS